MDVGDQPFKTLTSKVHYIFPMKCTRSVMGLMFYGFLLPGEERFTTESASVRPPEAGLHLGGESSGAQKQSRLPVSNSVP